MVSQTFILLYTNVIFINDLSVQILVSDHNKVTK